jgi:hypothetical protein
MIVLGEGDCRFVGSLYFLLSLEWPELNRNGANYDIVGDWIIG